VNPKSAAINATMKNAKAHRNISPPQENLIFWRGNYWACPASSLPAK